jgi:methionyl aminopeptidase
MAIRYKTEEQIETLRKCGQINARVLKEVAKKVKPGVKTAELNNYAERLLDEAGTTAPFLGYTPAGVKKPYPAALCVSVNEEVVHGIPGDRKLEEGDIVTLDLGVSLDGLITDHAITVPVGKIDELNMKLIRATQEGINAGISALKLGGHVGDFGAEVAKVAETKISPGMGSGMMCMRSHSSQTRLRRAKGLNFFLGS